MYFKRTFNSGTWNNIRSKTFAEYKCSICDHIHCEDITFTQHNKPYNKDIRCPKCGNFGQDDLKINIQTEIDSLIASIEAMEVKKMELVEKLHALKD